MRKLLSLIILAALVYPAYIVIDESDSLQEKKTYNAYLNDVSRGIFNPTEWKCKIVDIVSNKLTDFGVEDVTESIFDYVDSVFTGATEDLADEDVFVQIIDFILPLIEDYVMNELREHSDEINETIRTTLAEALINYVKTEKESKNYTADCEDNDKVILKPTESEEERILFFSLIFAMVALFLLAFNYPYGGFHNQNRLIFFTYMVLATGILLLITGVITPMMEIDARIIDFKFKFLNQQIIFSDQYLFYRSKSILEIVSILLKNNAFVAVMIFAFSILVPFTKLSFSFLIVRSERMQQKSRLVKIIGGISKWSMADVFVVAIFLATLGYQGIISEQLKTLTEISGVYTAVNTEMSQLQTGFYFFLAYCIISISSTYLISRIIKNNELIEG